MSQAAPHRSPSFEVTRNVRLFYVLGFLRELSPLLVIWVVYLTDYRHLTLAQVGLMEGLFWLIKLGAEIPSGAFADRYGRRLTFVTGLVLEASGVVVFALAAGFGLLMVSYGIWAAGLAFRSGNEEAYLYDALAVGQRQAEFGDRIGVYWALSISAVLIGGLLGGLLADLAGLRWAVLGSLAPYALVAPVVWRMQEPPRGEPAHTRASYLVTLRRALAAVRDDAGLRWMLLLQIALYGAQPAFFLLAQPFMRQHEVPLVLFGVLVAPVHLVWAGTGLISGRLVRRIGLAGTLGAAIGLGTGGLLVLTAVDHVMAFSGLAACMAGAGIAFPAIGSYVNDRTASEVRATVLSIAPLGSSLVLGMAGIGVGALAQRSLQLAFGAMALVVLIAAGGCFLAWMGAESRTARAVGPAVTDAAS
ncbi:MAG: MFS transporter [Dehalococcoidia bacterium]|nr:MFS transporter [Dehalococcoidia bacterium]